MAKRNPLDRLDEALDRLYDRAADLVDPTDPTEVPPIRHTWWLVTNTRTSGMVITDHTRCIITAPVEWNRYLGMNLEVLLTRERASASAVPGPQHKHP